jgi:alpha-beta hydrolase superfamily lysophospholipase
MSGMIFNESPGARVLVVLVHGSGCTPKDLRDLVDAVNEAREDLGDVDILRPDYSRTLLGIPITRFINYDIYDDSVDLVKVIDEVFQNRAAKGDGGYDRIILAGHSLGGLLIRKAYLIALGANDDNPYDVPLGPLLWAAHVSRLVLLAGMNRGWSFENKPKHMPFISYLAFRAGDLVSRPLPVARFFRGAERGSPFVVNLRNQWMRRDWLSEEQKKTETGRLLSYDPDGRVRLAPTVQILGTIDDVVSRQDSIDVEAGADFVYLLVRGTSHKNVPMLKQKPYGEVRAKAFRDALTKGIAELRGDRVTPPAARIGPPKDHIVFIMHGIRDVGRWTGGVRASVDRVAASRSQSVHVVTSSYGFLPMLSFLFLGIRRGRVRWFMDRYTEAVARHWGPGTKIHFIGHSNGTYLLASALSCYQTCWVNRVVFAGSVVRRDFPWNDLARRGRVTRVRNDVASADWVVGIFPRLFETLHAQDLGSAGHNGFLDDVGHVDSLRSFFRGGHGAAIVPENHDSVAQFVLADDAVDVTFNKDIKLNNLQTCVTGATLVDRQPVWVVLVSRLCWAVCLSVLLLAYGLGLLLTASWPLALLPHPWNWVVYILLMAAILLTI